MIQNLWQGKNKLYYLLIPFSWCYALVIFIRKILYQIGYFKSWKLPVPVVIVGNLTVGGTGKTPLVIWLVNQLKSNGLKVGVVSRGYKGKSQHYPILVDENSLASVTGDEPILIYQATSAPLAVAPSRVAACQYLLKHYDLDIIITDDGLQHYALQRDYEIVVVDYFKKFGNGHLLPAGPLREKLIRLNSVDKIIENGAPSSSSCCAMQLKASPYLVNLKTKQYLPLSTVKECYAMAGIGTPERFFNTLQQCHITILKQVSFSDHHQYQAKEIHQAFPDDEHLIIMTAKDAVKCCEFAEENWWYLPVDAVIDAATTTDLLTGIKSKLDKRYYENRVN